MKHFWNWVQNEDSTRTLYIDGVIASESWFDDDVTPKLFKEELESGSGDIVLWISSPGGDCIAASQIYTMLMEYSGNVTVKIDGLAASAASVVAMAGTEVLMSPTALLFIHDPLTLAVGNSGDMQKAIDMLDEVKESIINAYALKTGLSRAKIAHLMTEETWLNANKAIELGFADGMLEDAKKQQPQSAAAFAYSRRLAATALLDKLKQSMPSDDPPQAKAEEPQQKAPAPPVAPIESRIPAESLNKRLSLLQH